MKSINRGEQDGLHVKRGVAPVYELDEDDLAQIGQLDVLEKIVAFFTTCSYVTVGTRVCPYQATVVTDWMKMEHRMPNGSFRKGTVS